MTKKSTLTYIILGLIASALNYIAYPLFGRLLPASEYINITVSLSLLTQISTFLSSLVAITTGLSKETAHDGSNDEILSVLQTRILKIFILLGLLFLVVSPIIMPAIQTPTFYAIPIVMMVLISIPITIISGYLTGKKLLVKLGIAIVISASFQLLMGISVALLTRNGIITMTFMAIAQILALLTIKKIYSNLNLPLIAGLTKKTPAHLTSQVRSILNYTVFASFAIMAINLLQISDLLIIQRLGGYSAKFYTDIYVISRVVFFAGMILIWPFISEIDVKELKSNRKLFIKLSSYFALISFISILAILFVGQYITGFLFGQTYPLEQMRLIATLSILFKTFFLIITATCLYFIVLRSYVAIFIALLSLVAIFGYSSLVTSSSIEATLLPLTIISGILAVISFVFVYFFDRSI